MQWVLPGGAVLDGRDERTVAIRPLAAVRQGARHRRPAVAATPQPKPPERLATAKQWLELLAVLVGLIGAILALFGLSKK